MDRREGTYEITGQEVVFIPKGFFFVDEGPRRAFFGSKLLRDVKPRPETTEEKVENIRKIAVKPEVVPEVDEVLSVGPWDEKWNRTIQFRSGLHVKKVEQHLTTLTPYYARHRRHRPLDLAGRLSTRELGPDMVHDLLSMHPDFQEDRKLAPDVLNARRFRYCDFFAQAGWYDEASARWAGCSPTSRPNRTRLARKPPSPLWARCAAVSNSRRSSGGTTPASSRPFINAWRTLTKKRRATTP